MSNDSGTARMTSTPSKATAGQSAGLLRLAERCEKETAGSRELDVAICLATAVICNSITPSRVRNLRADPDERGWVLYEYDGDECTDHVREFTSSLDAAMSLVPEGWWWSGGVCKRENHASVGSETGTFTGEIIFETFGANLPLALCAAALRALASRDDVRGGK